MPTITDLNGQPVEVVRVLPARGLPQRAATLLFLVAIHTLPVVAVYLGTRREDWLVAAALMPVISFAVIVGLHRYFAHRSFETSRLFQFVLGLLSCLSFTDPISFAGKHRLHHRYSDTDQDVHSPHQGFWYCWFGSLIDEGYHDRVFLASARDLARYPELRGLHAWFFLPGVVLGAVLYLLGGFSMLAIGYGLSLVAVQNLTSSVNYCCHVWGSRPYDTADGSRNNAFVALLTFGEGWHNNHHYFPGAARAGLRWWELDPAYWAIRLMAFAGIVHNVREAPRDTRNRASLQD